MITTFISVVALVVSGGFAWVQVWWQFNRDPLDFRPTEAQLCRSSAHRLSIYAHAGCPPHRSSDCLTWNHQTKTSRTSLSVGLLRSIDSCSAPFVEASQTWSSGCHMRGEQGLASPRSIGVTMGSEPMPSALRNVTWFRPHPLLAPTKGWGRGRRTADRAYQRAIAPAAVPGSEHLLAAPTRTARCGYESCLAGAGYRSPTSCSTTSTPRCGTRT
jgi:hypothetical protein